MSGDKKIRLIYDVVSVPQGICLDRLIEIWRVYGLVIWDSQNRGYAPVVTDIESGKNELIDISTVGKEKLEQIQKLINHE
jgi:hypothetical protein